MGGLSMAARIVQATRKDNDGDIAYLCNFVESWAPRHKNDVILDIEANIHSYGVFIAGKTVEIQVVDGTAGKYLRTDPDKTEKNNLDELPNC